MRADCRNRDTAHATATGISPTPTGHRWTLYPSCRDAVLQLGNQFRPNDTNAGAMSGGFAAEGRIACAWRRVLLVTSLSESMGAFERERCIKHVWGRYGFDECSHCDPVVSTLHRRVFVGNAVSCVDLVLFVHIDGIGKAMAFGLAEKGMNVLLISRTETKLVDTEAELAAKCPDVTVEHLAIDYSNFDAEAQVRDRNRRFC